MQVRYITRKWPDRLVVRTLPFHGGNEGSNPSWATILKGNMKLKFIAGFAVAYYLLIMPPWWELISLIIVLVTFWSSFINLVNNVCLEYQCKQIEKSNSLHFDADCYVAWYHFRSKYARSPNKRIWSSWRSWKRNIQAV